MTDILKPISENEESEKPVSLEKVNALKNNTSLTDISSFADCSEWTLLPWNRRCHLAEISEQSVHPHCVPG